jgi:Rrf2 family transcriptional regulator, iron-sulfur cluster assembly transcription factor
MLLRVTRRAQLALNVLRALDDGRRHTAAGLAALVETTPAYLSQVMGPLLQAGWVGSTFGPGGGYHLTDDAADLSVLDVVEAMEGPVKPDTCLLRGTTCSDGEACAVHVGWSEATAALRAGLAGTSLGLGRSSGPVNPATRNPASPTPAERRLP